MPRAEKGPRPCIKVGYSSAQCIKLWNRVFRHCATVFGTVRLFRKNSFEQILLSIYILVVVYRPARQPGG